jgi:copper(I)-binding protein
MPSDRRPAILEIIMKRFAIIAGALALASVAIPAKAQNAAPGGPIAIEDAWARATPGGATTAAIYLTLANHGDAEDRLIACATPVAREVQIHAMTVEGDIMRMGAVSGGILLPPHRTVALKPGGYHLMLIGVKAPLKAGATVALTLRFARAGAITVHVPVKALREDQPPSGAH